jgi:acetyl esterase/lipase
MTKYLVLCFLLAAITDASVRGSGPGLPPIAANPVLAGLALDTTDGSPPASADAAPGPSKSCEGVLISRRLKYGESDLNVLDVATGDSREGSTRPVLLFVAGESFAADSATSDAGDPVQDAAMCFAARNKMVGVKVAYRRAPANPWPTAARDVAAATSWVRQNIDLFGGNAGAIVAVGYSAGAFHVASLLAHPELQTSDADIAGAVLVSGIYRIGADASAAEKSYFGDDASQYGERSAVPGILKTETPLLLAWSALDPPRLVAEGEKLKELLCNSIAHCPHTTVLKSRDNLAAVFGLDGAGESLAQPIMELIREIEARGLP